ncbi:HTH domain protein [Natronomonas pharaonis DSM 2160]|uniref:HTH domain protein n=1 Tax=Natronomonas pharaonis (strain ATCC 35678 / DSM 2160 / CIP 103997 / JCM 8858 / NBRC 14720 / NCIMB 2260 / Gabara) TaxID=348780 RepID=A0A1U7EZK1_NATPD|nr:sigma-70 region 4 domain-containing protein [Natronomonas pharaonis]CAI50756.1 HTH domain protein [Natronomonas pharaonis DSM 2160]
MTQLSLTDFDSDGCDDGLTELTEAEREAYVAVEQDGVGVREFARETERRPGTVGNLLRRARMRLGEDDADQEVTETW